MKINTGNPFVFVGLTVVSILAAGVLMDQGRRLPFIKDAKKGF
ncbi:hypothetical protein [Emcibacter nanhaiensis]|nr:hypothetical protein [Emcibacter nanhaiensis]